MACFCPFPGMKNFLLALFFIYQLADTRNLGAVPSVEAIFTDTFTSFGIDNLLAQPPEIRTPCDQMLFDGTETLGSGDRKGLYPRLISEQFPPDTIIYHGKDQNMHCHCATDTLMVCRIFVRPGSQEAKYVDKRLEFMTNPELTLEKQRPFFTYYRSYRRRDWMVRPILFESTPELSPPMPKVTAEIVITYDEYSSFKRSLSFPARYHRIDLKHIPIRQCTDDDAGVVCPILQTQFEPDMVVYILKTDVPKIEAGEYAPCISALGLRRVSTRRDDRKFRDPWKRVERLLTIKDDYEPYILDADVVGSSVNEFYSVSQWPQSFLTLKGVLFLIFTTLSLFCKCLQLFFKTTREEYKPIMNG